MTVMKLLIPLFLITRSTFAAGPGFSSGSNFVAYAIQGQVVVHCSDGTSASYNCRDSVLDPASYDYFIGPAGVKADEVALSCLRADGTRRDRISNYNSTLGRSSDSFNLWISTLFQRPLLLPGINKIDFQLRNLGQGVVRGVFEVVVNYGAPRTCPLTHYNSTDSNDCQSQYTVCQKYFEQYQYCR